MEISKKALYEGLMLWEQDNRAGNCIGEEASLALPIEERVAQSTECLWEYLGKVAG